MSNSVIVSYSHLDLSEYTEVKPSPPDFLNNIAQSLEKMNLDTILHYVYLPKDPMLSEQSLDNPDEYVNYSVVFESLRKKVKKIIKLKVEDNEDLPHSDEEIVNALQGIDVEIWDWVQYDLCCDTIAKAARNVKEVFLYSTGNKAVLQSWSSNEGLNKLKHVTCSARLLIRLS